MKRLIVILLFLLLGAKITYAYSTDVPVVGSWIINAKNNKTRLTFSSNGTAQYYVFKDNDTYPARWSQRGSSVQMRVYGAMQYYNKDEPAVIISMTQDGNKLSGMHRSTTGYGDFQIEAYKEGVSISDEKRNSSDEKTSSYDKEKKSDRVKTSTQPSKTLTVYHIAICLNSANVDDKCPYAVGSVYDNEVIKQHMEFRCSNSLGSTKQIFYISEAKQYSSYEKTLKEQIQKYTDYPWQLSYRDAVDVYDRYFHNRCGER